MGLIYLDSCVVIHAFEDETDTGERVRAALSREQDGRFAVSPLVMLECLVAPIRSGNIVLQRYYEEGFRQFDIIDVTQEAYLHAAHLRARFGLKTPDALHIATAQHRGCSALWTNDQRLASASRGFAVNVFA